MNVLVHFDMIFEIPCIKNMLTYSNFPEQANVPKDLKSESSKLMKRWSKLGEISQNEFQFLSFVLVKVDEMMEAGVNRWHSWAIGLDSLHRIQGVHCTAKPRHWQSIK